MSRLIKKYEANRFTTNVTATNRADGYYINAGIINTGNVNPYKTYWANDVSGSVPPIVNGSVTGYFYNFSALTDLIKVQVEWGTELKGEWASMDVTADTKDTLKWTLDPDLSVDVMPTNNAGAVLVDSGASYSFLSKANNSNSFVLPIPVGKSDHMRLRVTIYSESATTAIEGYCFLNPHTVLSAKAITN